MNAKELQLAVSLARKPVDDVLAEIVDIWASIGLGSDEVADRLLRVEDNLTAAIQIVRERERKFVKEEKMRLEIARDEASAIAAEVGDELEVSHSDPVRQQVRAIEKEHRRMESKFFEQSNEILEMGRKITAETDRMGLDEEDFAIPPDITGIAAVKAAKQKVGQLDVLHRTRVEDARRKQAKIKSLKELYGRALFFRLASHGEEAGIIEDVIVLERSAANDEFLADYTKFDSEEKNNVLSSGHFMKCLEKLEKEYLAAIARNARGEDGGKSSRKESPSLDQRKDALVVSLSASESPHSERSPRSTRSLSVHASPSVERRHSEVHRRQRLRQTGEKVQRRHRMSRPANGLRDVQRWQPSRSPSCSRHVSVTRTRRNLPRARSKSVYRLFNSKRKPSRSPQRSDASVEGSSDTLDLMQGKWVDKKGITYVIDDQFVRRNDGRKFPLFLKPNAIEWGVMAKYYARPDWNADKEVRWYNARNGNIAWIWERP